jgi:uncharacterized membrane protein
MTQSPEKENPLKPDNAPRPRIQQLADLIFGLALSIGAVSLLNTRPADVYVLIFSLLSFGFSFLILALIWVRYTRIMSALPVEKESIFAANFLLLFLVSMEPYLYGLISIQTNPAQIDPGTASAALAVDLGLMNLILAYFTHQLTIEEKKLIPANLLRSYRLQRAASFISAAIFLFSAIPIFTILERFVLMSLTFSTYPARRLLE